nr:uncharacterized protein LOC129273124 [Lytechinus pictus]
MVFFGIARCPDGWLEGHISNKCYFLEPEAFWWFTWYEARNVCADINVTDPYGHVINAQILVLESVDEMLELKQNVIESYQLWYDNWWYRMGLWLNCIGIRDVEDGEMFYCETNDEMIPMQYLDWGPGEPSHENVTGDILQDCVSTWSYYWPYVWTLQERSCEQHRAATICQIPRFEDNATEAIQSSVTTEPTKSSPSPSTTSGISEPQARCPVNWYEGENECYYISSAWSYDWDIWDVSFHFFWFTWYNARDLCAGMDVIDHNGRVTNPQLLVLESDEEMMELRQIILDSYEIWFGTSGWVWFNCNDMEEEGTFYCDKNGENITMSYTNWAENKPDDNVTDSVPENCIATFGYWPFEWTLDDVDCNDINYNGIIICEINKF